MKNRKNWKSLKAKYPIACNTAKELVRRFIARETVISVLLQQLKNEYDGSGREAKNLALSIFKKAKSVNKNADERGWSERLTHIFDGAYPATTREFLKDDEFVQHRYRGNKNATAGVTFFSDEYEKISPNRSLVPQMAPLLHDVEYIYGGKYTKYRVNRTPEVERFLTLEANTASKSALVELEVHNRPLCGIRDGWSYDPSAPPRRIITAKLAHPSKDTKLLSSFLEDLRNTFAWEDDESFNAYVAYLIQPTLYHYYPGQMPGYLFRGPTKSGKGYLSGTLPGLLYKRTGSPTVALKKIPTSDYELEVLLHSVRQSVFLVFDEIALAETLHMKAIDYLLTANNLITRKLQHGHQCIPNSFTVGLTAVNVGLTDENVGRLALVNLVEQRPSEITDFHRNWVDRGPELMAALFHKTNSVKINLGKLPKIPDRRPGFGLLAHVLKRGYDLEVSFPLLAVRPEILDLACQLYVDVADTRERSGWRVYSLKAVQDYFSEKQQKPIEKKALESLFATALSYGGSTRKHPLYRESGYPSDSGDFFHIELRKDTQRQSLWIQEVLKRKSRPKSWSTVRATDETTKTTNSKQNLH